MIVNATNFMSINFSGFEEEVISYPMTATHCFSKRE